MVNYPNGLKRNSMASLQVKKQDTSGRGYSLENALNASNEFYLTFNKAVIHKKTNPCTNC